MTLLKTEGVPWEESFFSSAVGLLSTTHFIEAKNSNYKGFKLEDLFSRTKNILKVQGYVLYEWSLTRFLIQHPVADKMLPKSYFAVTPNYFEPSDEEVKLYLNNPKFLWRFSMRNYGHFAKGFRKYLPLVYHNNDFANGELLTYDEDFSPLVAYVAPMAENSMKMKFKSKWYNQIPIKNDYANHDMAYKLTFDKINQIKKYFPYNKIITSYEVAECFHSNDYWLHKIDPNHSTIEFLQILITGYTTDGPGELAILRDQGNIANPIPKSLKELWKITKDKQKESKVVSKERKSFVKFYSNYEDKNDEDFMIQLNSCPFDASCYLGNPGTKYDKVRLAHLKELVDTCVLPSSKNKYYSFSTSDWNDRRLRFSQYQNTLYYVSLRKFGAKSNITNFVELDPYGCKRRFGWAPPCSNEQYMQLLSQNFSLDIKEPENFSKIPPLGISSNGEIYFGKEIFNQPIHNKRDLLDDAIKMKTFVTEYSMRHHLNPIDATSVEKSVRSTVTSRYNNINSRKPLKDTNNSDTVSSDLASKISGSVGSNHESPGGNKKARDLTNPMKSNSIHRLLSKRSNSSTSTKNSGKGVLDLFDSTPAKLTKGLLKRGSESPKSNSDESNVASSYLVKSKEKNHVIKFSVNSSNLVDSNNVIANKISNAGSVGLKERTGSCDDNNSGFNDSPTLYKENNKHHMDGDNQKNKRNCVSLDDEKEIGFSSGKNSDIKFCSIKNDFKDVCKPGKLSKSKAFKALNDVTSSTNNTQIPSHKYSYRKSLGKERATVINDTHPPKKYQFDVCLGLNKPSKTNDYYGFTKLPKENDDDNLYYPTMKDWSGLGMTRNCGFQNDYSPSFSLNHNYNLTGNNSSNGNAYISCKKSGNDGTSFRDRNDEKIFNNSSEKSTSPYINDNSPILSNNHHAKALGSDSTFDVDRRKINLQTYGPNACGEFTGISFSKEIHFDKFDDVNNGFVFGNDNNVDLIYGDLDCKNNFGDVCSIVSNLSGSSNSCDYNEVNTSKTLDVNANGIGNNDNVTIYENDDVEFNFNCPPPVNVSAVTDTYGNVTFSSNTNSGEDAGCSSSQRKTNSEGIQSADTANNNGDDDTNMNNHYKLPDVFKLPSYSEELNQSDLDVLVFHRAKYVEPETFDEDVDDNDSLEKLHRIRKMDKVDLRDFKPAGVKDTNINNDNNDDNGNYEQEDVDANAPHKYDTACSINTNS